MEEIPDDIYKIIVGFLSPREKMVVRMVSSTFKTNINYILPFILKLEKDMKMYYFVKYQLEKFLLDTNVPFIMYEGFQGFTGLIHIHYLFRIHNNYQCCIVEGCQEQSLKSVYIKQSRPLSSEHWYGYYTKRKLPYCLSCFNLWSCRETPLAL